MACFGGELCLHLLLNMALVEVSDQLYSGGMGSIYPLNRRMGASGTCLLCVSVRRHSHANTVNFYT